MSCVSSMATMFEHFVSDWIAFPSTDEALMDTMRGFLGLCKLPGVCGAMDGTFMPIRKPSKNGDQYWCYKKYCALLVLAVVDASGKFLFVSSSLPGSLGDASAWNTSVLKQ